MTYDKITKKQGFILSVENAFLENHSTEGRGDQYDHPVFLGLRKYEPIAL